MGYYTQFYGEIQITKLTQRVLQGLLEIRPDNETISDLQWMVSEGHMSIEENCITVECKIKNYDETIERICQLIASIDKQNQGEIRCWGEDRDDIWRIIIKNGKVIIQSGYIKYCGKQNYVNPDVKEFIKATLKDKKLSAWLL